MTCVVSCRVRNRDDLEDQLRGISMERAKIKGATVWCMDHAESAEEVKWEGRGEGEEREGGEKRRGKVHVVWGKCWSTR